MIRWLRVLLRVHQGDGAAAVRRVIPFLYILQCIRSVNRVFPRRGKGISIALRGLQRLVRSAHPTGLRKKTLGFRAKVLPEMNFQTGSYVLLWVHQGDGAAAVRQARRLGGGLK